MNWIVIGTLIAACVICFGFGRAQRTFHRISPRAFAMILLSVPIAACGTATEPTSISPPGSSTLSSPSVSTALTDAATNTSAKSLQSTYVAVVQRVLPSVVQIKTDLGLGSGIVFDSKGDVVTNNHVIDGAASLQVSSSTGHSYMAQLVGTYAADDLAVIRVNNAQLTPAVFADSTTLQVGDIVMAVGNPLGLQSSVTSGIVSATGRTVSEGNDVTLPDTIQTSAEINPGNSGGALVNLDGQVVGVPTLAATDPQLGGGAAPGIGFAIPSHVVSDIAEQLISQGRVTNSHRAYLGVTLGLSTNGGAIIASVVSGGPADHAGLQIGDIITTVNGTATDDPEAVTEALAGLSPGAQVRVTVTRQDNSQRTVTVTTGQLP